MWASAVEFFLTSGEHWTWQGAALLSLDWNGDSGWRPRNQGWQEGLMGWKGWGAGSESPKPREGAIICRMGVRRSPGRTWAGHETEASINSCLHAYPDLRSPMLKTKQYGDDIQGLRDSFWINAGWLNYFDFVYVSCIYNGVLWMLLLHVG